MTEADQVQARITEKSLSDLEERAYRALDEAAETHNPRRSFCLYSGGHDSLTSTNIGMTWGADAVMHVNTGCGAGDHEDPSRVIERVGKTQLPVEEKVELIEFAGDQLPTYPKSKLPPVRDVVEGTCDEMGWDLEQYRAEDCSEKLYEDMVLEYGFPGPAQHTIAFSWLKERAFKAATRENKEEWGDRVMFISGVREHESDRRMGVAQYEWRTGARLFVNPCLSWLGTDTNEHIRDRGLPRSPIKDYMEMSGECLCGSFAEDNYTNERGLIQELYPRTHAWFSKLEEMAERKGLPCRWGVRPSESNYEERPEEPFSEAILCRSCPSRHSNGSKENG